MNLKPPDMSQRMLSTQLRMSISCLNRFVIVVQIDGRLINQGAGKSTARGKDGSKLDDVNNWFALIRKNEESPVSAKTSSRVNHD